MEQPKQAHFTADEFIAWALEQPAGRFELDNGRVVAMAPERAGHAIAKFNAATLLRDAIRAGDLRCQMLPDGMSVRVDGETVYEPDALVRCGPPVGRDAIEVSDPVIVVEVVSPSSRGVDSGVKLGRYFSLTSVRHYLIVDIEKSVVIHHRRDDAGEIRAMILKDGTLNLDPPGLTIAVHDIFAEV